MSNSIQRYFFSTAFRSFGDLSLNRIEIKDANLSRFIDPRDIYYFEADGGYTVVKSRIGEFLVSKNLRVFENKLSSNPFFCRIHHRILLNLAYVDNFDHRRNEAILKTQLSLPVSSRKKESFLQAMRSI